MPPRRDNSAAIQKLDDLDLGAIVVGGAKSIVKNRPISVSLWAVGLLVAAFATGFTVDKATAETYMDTMQHADEVNRAELSKAQSNFNRASNEYYNSKGWFSCDQRCSRNHDKMQMAQAEMNRVTAKVNQIKNDARKEVGIWSTFGVQEVRNSFWSSWQSGKDWASRMTMYDAMFAMFRSREESFLQTVLQLVFQYIMNLTLGLCATFCYFIYQVYWLITAYGESFFTGLAFFLLVLVAGVATIGTYLGGLMGTVVGGGLYVAKQVAKSAALENERRANNPQLHGARRGYGNHPHSQ
jgi:hypothetical protein